MESGEIVLMNLFSGKERRHKQNGVVDTAREREGKRIKKVTLTYMQLYCVK